MTIDRRRLLRGVAGLGLAGVAGCTGNGSGNGNGDDGNARTPIPGDAYPLVGRWLTEEEIGGADDTYDGSIANRLDRDTVEVGVGTEGNGGSFAFGPSAVAVSVGTDVEFAWTGEGGAHNVEALPAEQLGESDYEFSSGEPTAEPNTVHTRTMDVEGIALYHCEPHLSLGMKGAIVVR